MMKVQVDTKKWETDGCIWVQGGCFLNDCYYEKQEFITYLHKALSANQLEQFLCQANGLFSLIINLPSYQIIAIDRSRVYPVFFRKIDEDYFVTDNASSLLLPNDTLDQEGSQQYRVSGYTFGPYTLVQGIYQVPPAHWVNLCNSQQNFHAYASYAIRQDEEQVASAKALKKVLDRVFKRLIQVAAGKQIVLPLTGGYDSRLIACMLKKQGYSSVLCYTLGNPNSQECKIAHQVANQLGFPIVQIDNERIAQTHNPIKEPLFTMYAHYMGQFGNFMWLFEYPALLYLREHKMVASDALFVPGHSADFIAGSHLKKAGITPNSSLSNLTSSILCDSFEYGERYNLRSYVRKYFQTRLQVGCTPVSAYQDFIIQHRMPYCINNAARIYSFFGYTLYLPFWDLEILNFFQHLPYNSLKDCQLYRQTIFPIFQELHVDFRKKELKPYQYSWQRIKNRMKQFFPYLRKWGKEKSTTGEFKLAQTLLSTLSSKTYKNSNDLLKDWYLHQVAKGFGKAQGDE